MTRRNLLTSLLGLLAAWGWKPKSDEPPPYKVMKITPVHLPQMFLGKTTHSAPAGSMVVVNLYDAKAKATGKSVSVHTPIPLMPNKWVCGSMCEAWEHRGYVSGGEC